MVGKMQDQFSFVEALMPSRSSPRRLEGQVTRRWFCSRLCCCRRFMVCQMRSLKRFFTIACRSGGLQD